MFLFHRRRPFIAAMCCVVSLIAAGTSRARATPPVARAMWVWGEADKQLPIWAQHRGIDTLLFEIPTVRLRAASTRTVIRGAQRRNINVWALSGHPHWAADHRAAKRWTRAVAGVEGLAGIVLDVEPYLLESWEQNRKRSIRTYLRMLRAVKKAAGDLPVMAAIPFWFDHDSYRTRTGTLASAVAERVDAIVVMAYRDEVTGTDGVAAVAGGEIGIASQTGKLALVALQTAADSLDKLTFHEEGGRALDAAIVDVERAFADQRGFGGVAVHHYRAYRELHR